MVFSLRIDIESGKGIREGIPKILDLLKKYNIKASFYLVMGGESNLFEILKNPRRDSEIPVRKIKIFSKKEMIRMLLFPRDFVRNNQKILLRILKDGHELGIHGWKHREWTRGFEKLNIKKTLFKSVKKYIKIFGRKPTTFTSPAFKTNLKIIRELEKFDFKFISDLDGKKPEKVKSSNITNIPLTITGKNKTPIIESLVQLGYSDEIILKQIIKRIKEEKYATMYIHDLYECREKIELIEEIFKYLIRNKIKINTIEEIGNEYLTHNK